MKHFIKNNQKFLLILLLGLFLLTTWALTIFDKPLKTANSPAGIVSFELAKSLDKSEAILTAWDSHAKTFAGLSLEIDFLYILVYTVLLAFLLFLNNQKFVPSQWFYKICHWLIYVVFIAGLFDVIENICLIQLLRGQRDASLSFTAYMAASFKFSILLIVILFLLVSWLWGVFNKRR